ncbi:hypothetical protein ACKJLK_10530, partial [Neisseria meningitidis]|uniref:hypothetical protein n=1 Tax=Neisseria meningitidis TaxID=487 RepID=UPI003988E4D4
NLVIHTRTENLAILTKTEIQKQKSQTLVIPAKAGIQVRLVSVISDKFLQLCVSRFPLSWE